MKKNWTRSWGALGFDLLGLMMMFTRSIGWLACLCTIMMMVGGCARSNPWVCDSRWIELDAASEEEEAFGYLYGATDVAALIEGTWVGSLDGAPVTITASVEGLTEPPSASLGIWNRLFDHGETRTIEGAFDECAGMALPLSMEMSIGTDVEVLVRYVYVLGGSLDTASIPEDAEPWPTTSSWYPGPAIAGWPVFRFSPSGGALGNSSGEEGGVADSGDMLGAPVDLTSAYVGADGRMWIYDGEAFVMLATRE